jgi:hypothetical protein
VADRPTVCSLIDSLYADSGFDFPFALKGKATVDADQHRFRGKVDVFTPGAGEVTFEFVSTMLFGTQREDFVFSVRGDTMRILDRERGQYFEGEDAEIYLAEALGVEFGVAEALRLTVGGPPPCGAMDEVEVETESDGGFRVSGRSRGASFHVRFSSRRHRLQELSWPLLERGETRDRLLVRYEWAEEALREVTMWMETREWRCRITAANI